MRALAIAVVVLFAACSKAPAPSPVAGVADADTEASRRSTLLVQNGTPNATVVYVAFGADSVVLPPGIPFCAPSGPLTCSFPLLGNATISLPLGGRYLNATLAFGAPVGCGATKAELNLNNPKWYDIADISLVDGWSNDVQIVVGATVLGPNHQSGNERALGVFPLGCDICTARQKPPCGMVPGDQGCKSGTQYHPDVICQWQGAVMGGGTPTRVTLVK